jgi:hypothetical protein
MDTVGPTMAFATRKYEWEYDKLILKLSNKDNCVTLFLFFTCLNSSCKIKSEVNDSIYQFSDMLTL